MAQTGLQENFKSNLNNPDDIRDVKTGLDSVVRVMLINALGEILDPSGGGIVLLGVSNALSINGSSILQWGGELVKNTTIDSTTTAYDIDFVNSTLGTQYILHVDGDGRVGVGTNTFNVGNPEKLLVDAGVDASVTVIGASANNNSYRQFNFKNISSGNLASGEYTATADTGTESANFVSLGINSSTYSDALYSIGGPLDSYLFSNGGDLTIGTASASTEVRFHTAGTTSAVQRGVITSAGRWGIGATTPVSLLANTNTAITDAGGRGIDVNGISWSTSAATTTYAAGIFNTSSSTSASGLLVKSTNTATSAFIFTAQVGSTIVLSAGGNSRVGVLTNAPASSLNNTSSAASQTDGTTAIASTGLGWQIASTGYGLAIVNTNNAANSNGLVVRVSRNASDASVLRVLYGGSTSALTVLANGNVGLGGSVAPAHVLTNSSTTVGIGSGNVAPGGVGWQGSFAGFAQGVYNSATAADAHGSFVYTGSTTLGAIVHEQRAGSSIIYRSWSDGFVDLVSSIKNTKETVTVGGTMYWALSGSTASLVSLSALSSVGALMSGMYVSSGTPKYRSTTASASYSTINLGGSTSLPFEIRLASANGAAVTADTTATLNTIFSAVIDAGVPKIALFNGTPAAKPTITGSRGGNTALTSLLTGLASLNIITDSTTA